MEAVALEHVEDILELPGRRSLAPVSSVIVPSILLQPTVRLPEEALDIDHVLGLPVPCFETIPDGLGEGKRLLVFADVHPLVEEDPVSREDLPHRVEQVGPDVDRILRLLEPEEEGGKTAGDGVPRGVVIFENGSEILVETLYPRGERDVVVQELDERTDEEDFFALLQFLEERPVPPVEEVLRPVVRIELTAQEGYDLLHDLRRPLFRESFEVGEGLRQIDEPLPQDLLVAPLVVDVALAGLVEGCEVVEAMEKGLPGPGQRLVGELDLRGLVHLPPFDDGRTVEVEMIPVGVFFFQLPAELEKRSIELHDLIGVRHLRATELGEDLPLVPFRGDPLEGLRV